jgi:hypothetical protein
MFDTGAPLFRAVSLMASLAWALQKFCLSWRFGRKLFIYREIQDPLGSILEPIAVVIVSIRCRFSWNCPRKVLLNLLTPAEIGCDGLHIFPIKPGNVSQHRRLKTGM